MTRSAMAVTIALLSLTARGRPATAALLSPADQAVIETTAVRLPRYQRVVLPNGLVVCVMPLSTLPIVEVRLMLRGGSADDPAGHAGVANLVARLLTHGTTSRSAAQLAADMAEAGGSLSADVGAEDLTISASVLADGTDVALRAVQEVALHPRFSPAEFALVGRDIRGDIAASRDDPSDLADRALAPALFGAQRFGHSAAGDERTLARITHGEVIRWHAMHARPDSAALAIVGAVDTTQVWQLVRDLFATWQAPANPPVLSRPRRPAVVAAARPGRHITLVPRDDITQAQVRCGEIACGRDSPDYPALQIANAILADGYTSRLVRDIRVARGLTYGISSRFAAFRHTGFFAISTSTQNRHLRQIVERTIAGTSRLVEDGPEDAEVARAQAYVIGQYPLGLQAPEDLAEQLIDQEFYPLPPDEVTGYAARIRAVTTAEVRRALRRWVHPARWEIVIVAPSAVARRALRGVAPITVMAPP